MTYSPPFLSAHNLEFCTPAGNPLLRDISFELDKGKVLAIAGPNGAGKTTLLNLLSGVSKPTTGHVIIDGYDICCMPDKERARLIAVVSQQSSPDARLTLREYVALGQMPIWSDYSKQEHSDALDHILSLTNLIELQDRLIGQLSGGEKQRAHIARALAQKPRLLFLDEPTNHLDPDAKGRVLSLAATLGVTVVMIIHDLVMIPEFATHVALMKDSRITAFGPVSEVQTPEAVRETFGVDYWVLKHNGRDIPALDIRKTQIFV